MAKNAIILTAGLLDDIHAKTAHGLIRGSDRFNIVGVVDDKYAGKDAGQVLDGINRNIPIFSSIKSYYQHSNQPADYCIIGVATKGGVIPEEFRPVIREALKMRMGIVSGLHESVGDDSEFAQLASEYEVEIIDIRKPRPATELKFWTGAIENVNAAKIPVLGTDCALGKRTTAMFLRDMVRKNGHNAHMVYTGQTGWMLGNKYGFIFDSTANDFVSGELESAVVKCYENENPDVIFLEGQSGLRNPSGPCGSEFIISANADGVILIHNPIREKFKGMESYKDDMPSPKDEIDLIRILGAPTIGLAINTRGISYEEAKTFQTTFEDELGIPVGLPLEEGVEVFYDAILKEINKYKN